MGYFQSQQAKSKRQKGGRDCGLEVFTSLGIVSISKQEINGQQSLKQVGGTVGLSVLLPPILWVVPDELNKGQSQVLPPP